MVEFKLAVIIPAYKSFFLEQTLHSFANQSNRNFTIYIGNDNSQDDIEAIILKFKDKLSIKYHKFQDNLGGVSLTKHWERCIELSNEKWIWLFSDDDLVDEDCVEKFYQTLDDTTQFYKFQTKIIDANNQYTYTKYDYKNQYSNYISSLEFITNRVKCTGFRSFAVEYIFSREVFQKYRFVEFPLAWASDDATWFLYSMESGSIKCIPANVSWRSSNLNISTSRKNSDINIKKVEASMKYCIWLKSVISSKNIDISDSDILNWFCIQISSIQYKVSFHDYCSFVAQLGLNVNRFILVKYFIIIKYYHLRNKF
jgi:glycosyltransferase involved in cell wall biosynthesis